MITKINSYSNEPNFQANILFNETLYKGFSKAKTSARLWNRRTSTYEKRDVNNFFDAINYLLKDGTKDVYEVRTGNKGYEPDTRCYLFKNGKEISRYDGTSLAENVMTIISEHVANLNNTLYRRFHIIEKARYRGFKQISKETDKIIGNKHYGDML